MSIYKKSGRISTPTTTREASSKQEKQIAKRVGGKTTPNSGATAFAKGDINISTETGKNEWLIEAKTCMTHKELFSIKKEWLEKNKREMVFMGKDYSALVFNFGPDEPNYFIIDELTFKELLDYQNNNS